MLFGPRTPQAKLEAGKEAFRRKNYKKAFELFWDVYFHNKSIMDPEANYMLGISALERKESRVDGRKLISQAASRGYLEAMLYKARGYEVCPGERKRALQLYERAAAQGSAEAKEAVERLRPLAEQEEAQKQKEKLEYEAAVNEIRAREYNEKQKAQKERLTYAKEAIEEGDKAIEERDWQKAMRCYGRVEQIDYKLEAGEPAVHFVAKGYRMLGRLIKAHGNNKSYAIMYFSKAADYGDAEALGCEGDYYRDYYDGDSVNPSANLKRAYEYYQKGASKGDSHSMLYCGIYLARGIQCIKDTEKAAEWFEKAAKKGEARAAYYLAELYEEGRGVPKDERKAAQWYEQAAVSGWTREHEQKFQERAAWIWNARDLDMKVMDGDGKEILKEIPRF